MPGTEDANEPSGRPTEETATASEPSEAGELKEKSIPEPMNVDRVEKMGGGDDEAEEDGELKEDVYPKAEQEAQLAAAPEVDPPTEETPSPSPPDSEPADAKLEKKEAEAISDVNGEEKTGESPVAVDPSGGGTEPETGDEPMGTGDQDTSQTEQADESATSKDLPYSTRGRSAVASNDTGSGAENRERGALDALEEIGRVKEHTSAASLGVSFLESLSEEERRTRTRFLPEVDGMHVLRKLEIREDIGLARTLASPAGVTSLKKSKSKRRGDDGAMDVDEEGASPSEDDRSSDVARSGTKVIGFENRDFNVPSNAFVAPPGTASEEGSDSQTAAIKTPNGVQSPWVVDAVVAFDPPRPPESVGAKKKHRMLRWERRPEDVEVDLNNYRKTVQRTRQELHSAEAEYTRLETIDAHLRWHFLRHLNAMNEEYLRLHDELGLVQQECVKAADLLTSRTRSRGAGKGSLVMRDVLTVLRARGAEQQENDAMETDATPVATKPVLSVGIGGLPSYVFDDWDRGTTFAPAEPASAWLVPGEKVKTPYGDGIVAGVHPAEILQGGAPAGGRNESTKGKENGKKDNSTKGSNNSGMKKTSSWDPNKDIESTDAEFFPTSMPARVSVTLPFGKGYFALGDLTRLENPAILSDSKLAGRWKKMVESSIAIGSSLDIEAMTSAVETSGSESALNGSDSGDGAKNLMDESSSEVPVEFSQQRNLRDPDERYLPFGAGMLPTAIGRGSLLHDLPITAIERMIHPALFEGKGVLGKKTNQGVTPEFRKWEDEEQEYLTLQASVLQLRNALVRQKRIRLLNERTDIATADRYQRAEELVAEMRADLKSLKHRLEEELTELGIDDEAAEKILLSFYIGQDIPVAGGQEATPLKRKRRSLSRGEEHDEAIADESDVANFADAEMDRDSEQGNDGLSGDDLDALPTSKKVRPNQ